MKKHLEEPRVDRTVMTVTDLNQNDDDQHGEYRAAGRT
jgi:hypothetical protein